MVYNYLQHYGIKGMKWGIRRYQNKDGTLTDAGQRRYDRDVRENNTKKKDNRIIIDGPDPNRWGKEDLKRSRNVVDSVSDINREFTKINDTVNRKRSKNPKSRMDLSNMSDKELRDSINRELLERQYNEVFSQGNTSRGREFTTNVLETAGSVLAVTGSALGIALAIKDLAESKG